MASLCFIALAVALWALSTTYGTIVLVALGLSALGDVALASDRPAAFMAGLGFFLLAHIAFSAAFAQAPWSWGVLAGAAAAMTVAKSFGADHTVDLQAFSGEALTKKILEITGGAGADVVLEVAGVSAAFTQGIQLVRTCGRLISIGNVSIDKKFEVPLAPGWITRKSVNIIGVVRYNPWYLLKSLKFLQRTFRNVDYEQLTDATFSLDQVQEALETSEKRIVTRAVIVPNP